MLPASQTADATVRTLVNPESDSITFAPNRTLGIGGLELSMSAENFPFSANKQDCAIDGAACARVEFDYADDHVNAGTMGSLAETISRGTGNFYAICQVVRGSFCAA
jgi:hypothetical protein